VQAQAEELKKSEERASQDRLQKLQEIDRKREDAVAKEKVQRSKDDRFFIIILGAGVILIILILAVLAIGLG
jgi:Flp pilus assembly protein TadB